jgi:hypothetical protein
MCDQLTLLNRQLSTNPLDQPNALFWDGPSCSGQQMALPQGNVTNMYSLPLGPNRIDSLWVPPDSDVAVTYNGGSYIFTPGLYGNLDDTPVKVNNITSINVRKTGEWMDHVAACCTGKVAAGATPESCGMWWGKTNNNGMCDDIMESYCTTHPDDPKCSCYAVPIEDKDDLATRALKANPSCWSANCSTKGYLPSNLINKPCPNVKICKQDISLPGSNNIVKDNQYIQDCSDHIIAPQITPGGTGVYTGTSPTGSSSGDHDAGGNPLPGADPTGSGVAQVNWTLYGFILLLCLVVGYVALGGLGSKEPRYPQMPYGYPPAPYPVPQ